MRAKKEDGTRISLQAEVSIKEVTILVQFAARDNN